MPKNHRNYQKTRHIALSGLLFALAMALSFIEGTPRGNCRYSKEMRNSISPVCNAVNAAGTEMIFC